MGMQRLFGQRQYLLRFIGHKYANPVIDGLVIQLHLVEHQQVGASLRLNDLVVAFLAKTDGVRMHLTPIDRQSLGLACHLGFLACTGQQKTVAVNQQFRDDSIDNIVLGVSERGSDGSFEQYILRAHEVPRLAGTIHALLYDKHAPVINPA